MGEEQAEKLQEHNFGLTFNKKNVRTGVRDLTLTIELSALGRINIGVNAVGVIRGTLVSAATMRRIAAFFNTMPSIILIMRK